MSSVSVRQSDTLGPSEQLRLARQVIEQESKTLLQMAGRLDDRFCQAVDLFYRCRGSVIVCGMGKAGLVGQKIMATLASTGTRSHFLHPAEAVHGDLGRVDHDDVVLMLSQSGETEEITRILPSLLELGVPIVAMTARSNSKLGQAAAVVLELGRLNEACPLGLAPTASTTAMLALGDALALVASRMRNFAHEDFARSHPAGSLGRKLSKVDDHLRTLSRCRVASQEKTVRRILVDLSMPGRRTGAIMLVDGEGKLSGVFTDSDLARLFEQRREQALDHPICEVMTTRPMTVQTGTKMTEAVAIMAQRKISELPVVDAEGRPVGLIDVTDVVAVFPELNDNADQRPSSPELLVFPGRRAG
ncbi:MAG: KpsF/GutQ family sugar-phosphate isomerase [Thermoguttaceae bacterium]|jgi:arabinose-5-phosphate isomerase|nr:KpsF/GutQ family sugar-phosphate isomerase [Thermoguttaceae bacterium]